MKELAKVSIEHKPNQCFLCALSLGVHYGLLVVSLPMMAMRTLATVLILHGIPVGTGRLLRGHGIRDEDDTGMNHEGWMA